MDWLHYTARRYWCGLLHRPPQWLRSIPTRRATAGTFLRLIVRGAFPRALAYVRASRRVAIAASCELLRQRVGAGHKQLSSCIPPIHTSVRLGKKNQNSRFC